MILSLSCKGFKSKAASGDVQGSVLLTMAERLVQDMSLVRLPGLLLIVEINVSLALI
jgi:hypothetical protein